MGYHMAVTDLHEGGSLEELATLPDEGITSYKLFMAYKGALMVDDETLFATMEVAAQTGALVMVHAENGDLIDVLVRQALEAGNTEPLYHALTRPPEAEGEATNRAIQLAHVAGAPLYVVHVTCREAVEPIARAREAGWDVWGETCTQYFFNSLDDIAKPNFEGAKYVYSPPVRDKSNWDVLWNAVRTDALSAISTDHCAFLWDGQKTLGKDDFSKIPNGGPGLENRLHMIHEFGARAGRISLNRMVELLATSPAKLFGLYPKKGTVAVGSDADLVIFDPERKHTITAANQHSKTDYNLYEGTEVTGTPEVVLLRGNVLVENDELVASPGIGQLRGAREVRPGAAREERGRLAAGGRRFDHAAPARRLGRAGELESRLPEERGVLVERALPTAGRDEHVQVRELRRRRLVRRRRAGARRGAASRPARSPARHALQDRDRLLVLPVVDDRLQDVGVAARGNGLEEVAADHLAPLGQLGAGDDVRLVEEDPAGLRGYDRGSSARNVAVAAAHVDDRARSGRSPRPRAPTSVSAAGLACHRAVEARRLVRSRRAVGPDVLAVNVREGVLAGPRRCGRARPRRPRSTGGPDERRPARDRLRVVRAQRARRARSARSGRRRARAARRARRARAAGGSSDASCVPGRRARARSTDRGSSATSSSASPSTAATWTA